MFSQLHKNKKKSIRKKKKKMSQTLYHSDSSPLDSKSSGTDQPYIPFSETNNIFQLCVYFLLFILFFPRHWTVAHCRKHGCYNRCWLRQRETLWYTLHYCMTPCRHITCANLHCWEKEEEDGQENMMDKKTRQGKHINKRANKGRRELYIYCATACQKHSFISMYLNRFRIQIDKVRRFSEAWQWAYQCAN